MIAVNHEQQRKHFKFGKYAMGDFGFCFAFRKLGDMRCGVLANDLSINNYVTVVKYDWRPEIRLC